MEIIAHRGTPRELPENSLPGFARALEAGAQGIELDVHLTADGVVVVHHDPVLHGVAVDRLGEQDLGPRPGGPSATPSRTWRADPNAG